MFVCGSVCPQDLKDVDWLVNSDLVHCLEHWLHYSWQARVPLAHSETKLKLLYIGGNLKVSKESESIQGKGKVIKDKKHYSWQAPVPLSHSETKLKLFKVKVLAGS